jgi:glycosyltransferase involved in cell wall biosynthesis
VLFLGVRRAYKGFDLLLDAARRVASVRPTVTFVFAGPGDSIQPSPDASVLDVGVLDERDRAGWLEAADLLCLPSEAEIFPGSFLEAWSVRTPVLASDLPTLREVMERSGGGVTVPRDAIAIAEAILELLHDRSRLERLGANGRSFWESECTPRAVAEWHERLYESLLGIVDREERLVAAHA